MKTILLLRHAKSDWDAPAGGDHARPLTERGQKAARRMGRFLAAAGLVPDRVVTSTATRAQETLREAMEAGGWAGVPVRAADALYEASPDDVLAQIQAEADDADVLLLVGHEPTWSTTASRLAGGASVEMPTGALARVEVDAARWADVGWGAGALALLVTPKALKGLKPKKGGDASDDVPEDEPTGPAAGGA